MREIWLAKLDKVRPIVILTRSLARPVMSKVTVAPITSTIKGLSSEVRVDRSNGLDATSVIAIDNVITIPATNLIRRIGNLHQDQERHLASTIVVAFDLDIPLMR